MLGKSPQGPTQSAFNGSRLLLSFFETLCASLRAWLCREKNKNWAPLFFFFFFFFFQQCFSLWPPSPFLLGRFSQAVLLPSAAFLSRSKAGTKNVMCILDKEICDVGTFSFLLYMCLHSSFCLMGEGKGGSKMPFGAVQSNGIVAFGFLVFLTVMMLKWCSCVTWAAVLLVLGAYWWCILMLGRRSEACNLSAMCFALLLCPGQISAW